MVKSVGVTVSAKITINTIRFYSIVYNNFIRSIVLQDCSMTPLSYIITIVLYRIVLYSIKRDWPPFKVVWGLATKTLNVTNNKCIILYTNKLCIPSDPRTPPSSRFKP